MTERSLRWGILSTAKIGRNAVVPAIQRSRNGQVVAIASRDPARAQAYAAEAGIPTAYGSYEELLSAADVDAIYIPTPNSEHAAWTMQAARMGKHILCEKPLGLNAAECLEMEVAARESGVLLMEAFMYRFHPQIPRLLELVAAQSIGALRLIRASFTFALSPERANDIRLQPHLGGGALMDVGCYCVNFSRLVAGAEPVEAQAFANLGPSGVDEQLVGTLRFADGLLAQLDCGLRIEFRNTCHVVGTSGYLELPAAFLPGEQEVTLYQRRDQRGSAGEIVPHTLPGANHYQLMVEHFADCAINNTALRYPAADAVANMRVIDALYRSARNGGRPEPVA